VTLPSASPAWHSPHAAEPKSQGQRTGSRCAGRLYDRAIGLTHCRTVANMTLTARSLLIYGGSGANANRRSDGRR
jgi:hypothetical protein